MEPVARTSTKSASPKTAREHLWRAMDVQLGPMPPRDEVLLLDEEVFALSRDAFWFQSPSGVRFHYRRGGRITAHYDDPGLEDEFHLYLYGTAYGSVAWLNDLLPLHASAVAAGGRAIAFSGPSGAGKSTLAAALCDGEFRLVCDDTLVLVPDENGPVALPDNKPMKLWEDALAMLGAEATAPIASLPGKHYAQASAVHPDPVRLSDLVFLDQGDQIRLDPITGSAKFGKLLDALYRGFVHVARDDRDLHARLLVETASSVRFWTLERPLKAASFQSDTAHLTKLITSKLAL